MQSKGYAWITEVGDLIEQGKLVEAGQKKNEGFAIFDELGRIQNSLNSPVEKPVSSGSPYVDVFKAMGFKSRWSFDVNDSDVGKTMFDVLESDEFTQPLSELD